MALAQDGQLLRIFTGESYRHHNLPVYEWILHEARKHGLAGATVLRGVAGYGAGSHIHAANILRLSSDMPIVIEIVDEPQKIEYFLALLEAASLDGLITTEKATIKFHRALKPA